MARNKDSEEEVYYMEKILDKRIGSNGKLEYLIAWENFGPDENSWEPESNILCPVMLKVRVSCTVGIVPTDIIFAGSTFLLYSYSSKNFPANGVNETNATGSALSHTICSKDIC